MRQVRETLETVLSPGRRFRLSPFVEATQLVVLFGQVPDDRRRAESIRAILEDPASQQVLDEIAGRWEQFQQHGKPFSKADTYQGTFLRSYLAYYTTSNIPKLQAVLTELVGIGALPSPSWQDKTLNVLDIGVGPGTTALAVLDFLLAWHSCCLLWSQPFPLTSVELVGIDRSPEALAFAQTVTRSFGDQVVHWVTTRDAMLAGNDSERTTWAGRGWAEQIYQAAAHARWETVDLTRSEDLARGQELARWANVIVASYVLRELRDARSEDNLSTVLAAAQPGALVLLLESGAESDARGLMRWRRRFLHAHPEFRAVLPCGQEFSPQLPECCDSCWPSRREGLHQTALYRVFVDRCPTLHEPEGSDRYDDFQNELLSWTYVVLQRVDGSPAVSAPVSRHSLREGERVTLTTRFVGNFRGEKPAIPDPNEDRASENGTPPSREFVKLCPARVETSRLDLERTPGFVLPRLRYGAELRIENVAPRRHPRSQGWILEPDGRWTRVEPVEAPERSGNGWIPSYSEATRDALDDLAYRLFGFPTLRSFQHLILQRVLTGRSVLGIAATGSGKSECFILPAMLLPGFTVVVSPLKALMQDQFEQRIKERYGLDFLCTYLNGEVPMRERDRRLRLLEQGYFKLVYVTPEQLQRDWVIESLRRAHQKVPGGFRYLAMDEAHCVSQWGHDFRPAYLNIVQRLRQHGLEPTVIALTATASPQVREDLCRELQLDQRPIEQGGDVLVDASNRPELNLIVRVVDSTQCKAEKIAQQLRDLLARNRADPAQKGAAIVFMPWTGHNESKADRSSPRVTEFAAWLETKLCSKVSIYHGKMDDDPAADAATGDEHAQRAASALSKALGDMSGRSRRAEQEAFLRDERTVMVATKGFGMGVDKPNIRLILHRTPPANMEAYWQEAGRAGRDGQFADVIVYFSPDSPATGRSDYEIQKFFLQEKYVRHQDVDAMVAFLRTLQPTRAGTLYFTSDEVIAFLEQPERGFEWPDFGERRRYEGESSQDAVILERGHQYGNKCRYIDRILQALQSYRPYVDGHFVSLVDEVHQCGTELRQVRFAQENVERIFTSNLYFGHFLREKEQQIPHLRLPFVELVKQGDVLALADLLELPVHETGALLADIRQAEGQWENGKNGQRRWRGTLLDFTTIRPPLRGPAAGKTTLRDWRDYAGACKRASDTEARRRATEHGRGRPILDDWFSWRELEHPRGWEVALGTAFTQPVQLERYVQAFVEQMERRRQYDWEAYERFLTEYIGVERTYLDHWQARSGRLPCLRGVVLGYLKTGEVVTGQSCLSCSRCVPDLAFSTDLEARRRVIERLRRELADLLDRLERVPDRWVAPGEIDELAAAVTSEIAAGRRVGEYLAGLTDRILTDTPEHRPALLVRLLAACRGWIELPPDEVVQLAERMIELASDPAEATVERILDEEIGLLLQRVPALSPIQLVHSVRARWYELQGRVEDAVAELEELRTKLEQTEPGTTLFQHLVQARRRLSMLWSQLGNHQQATRELEWLADNEPEPAHVQEALERLYALHEPVSAERARETALRLARLLDDRNQARAWYERAGLPNWTSGRLVDEMLWIHRYRRTWWRDGLKALLPTWLLPEQEDRTRRLADELGQRIDAFRPPLGLDDLRAIRSFLDHVSAWAESTLAERYAEALLAALHTTTPDDRQDLAHILGGLSGQQSGIILGVLTDLATNRVSLGREPVHEILDALSGHHPALWRLIQRLPAEAMLQNPASWLALLQEQALPHLQPEQRAHVLALLLRSTAQEPTPTALGPLVDVIPSHLHEPQVRTVVEQALPALRDRLSDLPEEQLTPLLAALTEPEHGSFVTIESALATLELVLGLAARSSEETMATLVGTVRRLTQTEALLSSAPALFDICELLRSAPPIPDETWHGLAEYVQSDVERQGGAALYLLALLAARAGRDHDAAFYLALMLLEVSLPASEKAKEWVELVVDTARDLALSDEVVEEATLVDEIIRIVCDRSTWLATSDAAKHWLRERLGKLLLCASPGTIAEILLDPAASTVAVTAYLDTWQVLTSGQRAWIDELIAQCEARLAVTPVDIDFDRLNAVRRVAEPHADRWRGSALERSWNSHVGRSTIAELRRTGNLFTVRQSLDRADDGHVVSALVELVPDNWTIDEVTSLAHSVRNGASGKDIETLVSFICKKPTNEYWAERGLDVLLAARAAFPSAGDSLEAIERWCRAIAEPFSARADLRSKALAILLACSAARGRLLHPLRGVCRANPDIFREALSLIRRQSQHWYKELSTLALAQRIVEDWLQLCPPRLWRDPASAQDCIDRLHRLATRELSPLEVEPFLRAVLDYFGLKAIQGDSASSSEPIRYMLECLYYSSTGLPKQHGKRAPQLLEEA